MSTAKAEIFELLIAATTTELRTVEFVFQLF